MVRRKVAERHGVGQPQREVLEAGSRVGGGEPLRAAAAILVTERASGESFRCRGRSRSRSAHVLITERMTDLADGVLVARVRSGDREAFGLLVERYQDKMMAYVRYMGFREAEALDVVQDAFVRAYRHLGRCGDPDRFDGWLFKIVSNLCRTMGKRTRRRKVESLELHQASLVSNAPGPEECLEASRLKKRVRAALDTVPADQREALVLMYLQGLSVEEISKITGASSSAVKMRLKRGREVLKTELASLVSEA